MRRWETIFKTLSNLNRLKIVKLLENGGQRSVSELADALKISIRATSRHLNIMERVDLLEDEGRDGHVFYRLSRSMPADFKVILNIILK